MELAPCKCKNTETECVIFTIALAGRGVIGGGGLPRVSLRLPWAKEVIGLSARLVCFCHILITGPANDYFTQSRATPSEAKLTIRCESRLRPELLDVMRSSNHSKCRMSLFLSCSCPLFLSVPFWGEGGEALRLSDF